MTVKKLLNTLEEGSEFWYTEYKEAEDKKWVALAQRAYIQRIEAISLIKAIIDEEKKQKREQA